MTHFYYNMACRELLQRLCLARNDQRSFDFAHVVGQNFYPGNNKYFEMTSEREWYLPMIHFILYPIIVVKHNIKKKKAEMGG